jgi:GntR family transcriptional regulator, rspAB operon transcriptional repressor
MFRLQYDKWRKAQAMKRILTSRITDQVYDVLRQEIIKRTLKPNSKIDINALAQEMGVSRTPVFDALTRLENEGLVIRRNRVGTFVAPLDRRLYEETFEARNMVEQFVTPLSIEHLTDEAIAELEALLSSSEILLQNVTDKTFDYISYTRYDQDFHLKLVGLCENQHIIDFYKSLNAHMQIARAYSHHALPRATEGYSEHRRILNAFKARDIKAARRAQSEHLQRSQAGISAVLDLHGLL